MRSLLLASILFACFADARADPFDPDRWLRHVREDLLRYWDHPDAVGSPPGAFASRRCNDGTAFNADAPCPEIDAIPWVRKDRQSIVALSRQIYAYGVAFHMTGEPRYLELAEAGARHQLTHMSDPKSGLFFEWLTADNRPEGPVDQQRSQVQAYTLLGLSFLYYLTGNEDYLRDILRVHKLFKTRYLDEKRGHYRLPGDDAEKLASQLDHLNAYMRLITPLLSSDERKIWTAEMLRIAEVLKSDFFLAEEGVFRNSLSEAGFDYGHSIKAFWFIRMAGSLSGRLDLIDWSEHHGRSLLDLAFQEEAGTWASGLTEDDQVDPKALSWIHAELDQFAASISIEDDTVNPYLRAAYGFWLNSFVDRDHGGIWNDVDLQTGTPGTVPPKHWPWKAGYHSFEHALVAYVAAGAVASRPVRLFYARDDLDEAQPYYFRAAEKQVTEVKRSDLRQIQAVDFSGITW
ncbi:MAG: AGE family epimerase/isomerase [Pseudomonadota bacterium]